MKLVGLTGRVIGCAIEVHCSLGPGLLESTYERCLATELGLGGLSYRRQCELPVEYKGEVLECGYRLDFLIEESLVLELKSVEALNAVHEAQVLTYIKLAGVGVGLLVNFNVLRLKDGLRRFVL